MGKVRPGRFTAEHEGDVVVFLIGMRLNRPWKLHKWLPVFTAMPRMLRWLGEHPQEGMLGAHQSLLFGGPAVVQYWRSFEDLDRFASNPDAPHLAAWRRFNRRVGSRSGDVGIWHETYVVPAGRWECVHVNMPATGLPAATGHVPVARRGTTAGRRLGVATTDEPAVAPS